MEQQIASSRSVGANRQNTESDVRQPQVTGAAVELNSHIEELNRMLETLAQRLGPVLAPCAPTESKGHPSQVRPARAALAEMLDGASEQVRRAEAAVRDLMGRLEI